MEEEVQKYGSFTVTRDRAWRNRPSMCLLVAGDQARGLINLINMEREHAFSDSDVRLCKRWPTA